MNQLIPTQVLHSGWKAGRLNLALSMLEIGANINSITSNGYSLLHCVRNKAEIDLLFRSGFQLQTALYQHDGLTPMHTASSLEVVTTLLNLGFDPNGQDAMFLSLIFPMDQLLITCPLGAQLVHMSGGRCADLTWEQSNPQRNPQILRGRL